MGGTQGGSQRHQHHFPNRCHTFDCKIAGEVKNFNADSYFGVPKDARRADRYVQLAVAASKMAMEDCGVNVSEIDPRRFGVMVGSGIGGLSTLEREHSTYMTKGPKRVSPFTIPMMISNIASGIISMEFGLYGPNMVIVIACATSNHNIGEAGASSSLAMPTPSSAEEPRQPSCRWACPDSPT